MLLFDEMMSALSTVMVGLIFIVLEKLTETSLWLSRHVAPLGHIILIPSQQIFALTH
jgi:hypothetical protein